MEADKIIDIVKNVSDISDEVYADVVQPPAQNVGKSLGTVTDLLNTLLTPIELLNKTISLKKEKFLEEYKKNLKDIPEEKVITPNFSLIGPMIEHLKYKITEDELRKKYAKLISEASNTDGLTKPLLSFENVLDQLSPYEIELLSLLFSALPDQVYPIASIKVSKDVGYNQPYKNIPGVSFKNLPFETASVLISNFERLGIVYIDPLQYVEPASERYAYLENSLLYQSLQIQCLASREQTNLPYPACEIEKHMFCLTEFGKSFVATVIA
jgi:hypothetical protein